MMERFDLGVVGGGPGGYVAAVRAAQLGASVCLIEKDKLGGACLNWGCIPSKAIIASAHLYEALRDPAPMGLRLDGSVSLDPDLVRKRTRKVVDIMVRGIEGLMKANGVTVIPGRGRLAGPGRIEVADGSGGTRAIEAGKIVLATGSVPATLPGVSLDGERVISSDQSVWLESLPKSLFIVGAGIIGSELAFIYNSFGTEVTLLEALERPIPLEDQEMSALLEGEFKKRKIKLHTKVRIDKVTAGNSGVSVHLEDGRTLQAEQVLLAVGRRVATEDIGLETVGVKAGRKGEVLVNERMATSAPDVWAIGDMIGGLMLAHVASAEGLVAVDNALGRPRSLDYRYVPSAIFTEPEIASCGMTEEEAARNGFKLRIGRFPFRVLGKAHAIGEITGLVKLVVDEKTDRILGAHIMGPRASDLIHTVAVGMRCGIRAETFADAIFAHPTLSEALMEAGHDVHGRAIHLPPKARG